MINNTVASEYKKVSNNIKSRSILMENKSLKMKRY